MPQLHWRGLAALLAWCTLMPLTLAGEAQELPVPPAPSTSDRIATPIPPQPAPGTGTCTRTTAAPDTWTTLTEATDPYGPSPFQITVDPWRPCLLYRAITTQDMERSLDAGKTWQPILHDAAASHALTFSARDMQVARPDSLVLAEAGNGDAVLRSDDQGSTWRLADGGIEGMRIAAVDVAPDHPEVLYATGDRNNLFQLNASGYDAPAALGLFVSRVTARRHPARNSRSIPMTRGTSGCSSTCGIRATARTTR